MDNNIDENMDISLLRGLVRQANNQGYKLVVRKSKKYPYIVSGQSPFSGWPVKMGGTANWLYRELLGALVERGVYGINKKESG